MKISKNKYTSLFFMIYLMVLLLICNINLFSSEYDKLIRKKIHSIYGKRIYIKQYKFEIKNEIKRKIQKKVKQVFISSSLFVWKVKKNKIIKATVIMDTVRGRSNPIKFFVVFNNNGSIKKVFVLEHLDDKGRAVTKTWWLKGFENKNANSSLTPGIDIDVISGATVSVNSLTKGIKKLTYLFPYL